MSVINDFPRELEVVGRILISYSELELGLLNAIAIGLPMNIALKSMYRTRGETPRIDIVSGIGRKQYVERGLTTEFDTAIEAVRYCLKIRNKFAHTFWHSPSKNELCYVSLEDLAKTPGEVNDLLDLDFFYIDLMLLQEQFEYFQYAKRLIAHMNYQSRVLSGEMTSNPFPLLEPVTHPRLCTRKGRQGAA